MRDWLLDGLFLIQVFYYILKIEKTNRFKKEYELIGKDARKLVDRLEESLMNGYIYEDDPDNSTKEETHCLEDFNEYTGNYPHLVYSKRITGQLRFNYSIYKPKQITKNGRTYYESRVVLENCWDHKFRDIEHRCRNTYSRFRSTRTHSNDSKSDNKLWNM